MKRKSRDDMSKIKNDQMLRIGFKNGTSCKLFKLKQIYMHFSCKVFNVVSKVFFKTSSVIRLVLLKTLSMC